MIAVALALPSLLAPLVADEHLQASRWRDRRSVVGFLGDCIVFASVDPAEGRARMEHLGLHRLVRSPSQPFRAGDAVALSDVRATVAALTGDGRPRTVGFRFATPLESAGRRWMRGAGLGLVPWAPPPIGATVIVPAPR